mgnify:CR=1 FL=1
MTGGSTEGVPLDRFDGAPCPDDDCAGTVERQPSDHVDALVCPDCETVVVRVWNP